MKPKVTSYKGFKIKQSQEDGHQVFKVYTNEEWAYGKVLRSSEWEACSLKEAKDFIDSYDTENPVTEDNFLSYSDESGFVLMSKED